MTTQPAERLTVKLTKINEDERTRHLRRALILEANGTPEKQKDDLVNEILTAFTCPEYWPMTDAQRCELLRKWFTMARNIRQTENA